MWHKSVGQNREEFYNALEFFFGYLQHMVYISQKFWVAVTLGAVLYINGTPIALANHQPSQNYGSGNIYLILFGLLVVGAASVVAYSAWNKKRKHRLRKVQRSSRRKRR